MAQNYSPYSESTLEALESEWQVAPNGFTAGSNFKAWLANEVLSLRMAIIETLENNRDLADGEKCTLWRLKKAVNWE